MQQIVWCTLAAVSNELTSDLFKRRHLTPQRGLFPRRAWSSSAALEKWSLDLLVPGPASGLSELLKQAVQLHMPTVHYLELSSDHLKTRKRKGNVSRRFLKHTGECTGSASVCPSNPGPAWARWSCFSWLERGCLSQTCTKWPKVCPGELWAELLHMEKVTDPMVLHPVEDGSSEQCKRRKQRGELAAHLAGWWFCSETAFIFHGISNLPSQNSLFITVNWKQM